MDVYMAKN